MIQHRLAALISAGALLVATGPSTLICRQCGAVKRPKDRAARIWSCEECSAVYDQDANAAQNLLAASTGGERFGDAVRQEWESNGLRARVKS